MMKQKIRGGFGVIGLGRFGTALARLLAEAGEDVVVLDEEEIKIRQVRDVVQEAYIVGKLTPETIAETGIEECATVAVCISKVDVSVLTAQTLLEMGVPRVVCKADSRQHGLILEKIGAEVVYPEVETATKLAGVLLQSKAIDLMRLNGDYVISEIKIPLRVEGIKVKELQLSKYSLRLVCLEVEPNKTLRDCEPDYILHNDDAIVVLGKFGDVERFEKEMVY